MAPLMRTDPFRELDRLAQQFLGYTGTSVRPAVMPMDAYRLGDDYIVTLDVPGVSADSIDLTVERNVLTVKAERKFDYGEDIDVQIAERPRGVFSRELFLGETLDADNITADYDAGVLTLRIPVVERAKARKIAIGAAGDQKAINA